jgi:hypothetical protein
LLDGGSAKIGLFPAAVTTFIGLAELLLLLPVTDPIAPLAVSTEEAEAGRRS